MEFMLVPIQLYSCKLQQDSYLYEFSVNIVSLNIHRVCHFHPILGSFSMPLHRKETLEQKVYMLNKIR